MNNATNNTKTNKTRTDWAIFAKKARTWRDGNGDRLVTNLFIRNRTYWAPLREGSPKHIAAARCIVAAYERGEHWAGCPNVCGADDAYMERFDTRYADALQVVRRFGRNLP